MTESEIIKACIKEDPRSQKLLYEQFLPYILGICRRFNIAQEDTRDLIQEIFIEIFLSLKKFDAQKGELKFWIKSIAIHKILSSFRRKKIDFSILEGNTEHLIERDVEIQNLEAEYLLKLVQELPDGYRTIFNLYVIDGFTHKEIAEMLGIRAESSRSQLSRAKKLLQHKLLMLEKT